MNNIIEIDHLSKTFGEVKAVQDLSFRVKEGELFAFLGVNGAGKSTTVNFPLSTQGQVSAVGTIVSAGYGFVCGAYMPISNFGEGLQKVMSYLPGTYGTALIKNHMLRGVFKEMETKGFPAEVVNGIATSLDCNPTFQGNVVEPEYMMLIMIGTVVLLGGLYLLITALPEKK